MFVLLEKQFQRSLLLVGQKEEIVHAPGPTEALEVLLISGISPPEDVVVRTIRFLLRYLSPALGKVDNGGG